MIFVEIFVVLFCVSVYVYAIGGMHLAEKKMLDGIKIANQAYIAFSKIKALSSEDITRDRQSINREIWLISDDMAQICQKHCLNDDNSSKLTENV